MTDAEKLARWLNWTAERRYWNGKKTPRDFPIGWDAQTDERKSSLLKAAKDILAGKWRKPLPTDHSKEIARG